MPDAHRLWDRCVNMKEMDEQPRLAHKEPNKAVVVGAGVGKRQKTSPVWTQFEVFFPSTANGSNVGCIVATKLPAVGLAPERVVLCHKMYKYVRLNKVQGITGSGTGNLLKLHL